MFNSQLVKDLHSLESHLQQLKKDVVSRREKLFGLFSITRRKNRWVLSCFKGTFPIVPLNNRIFFLNETNIFSNFNLFSEYILEAILSLPNASFLLKLCSLYFLLPHFAVYLQLVIVSSHQCCASLKSPPPKLKLVLFFSIWLWQVIRTVPEGRQSFGQIS